MTVKKYDFDFMGVVIEWNSFALKSTKIALFYITPSVPFSAKVGVKNQSINQSINQSTNQSINRFHFLPPISNNIR